MMEEQILYPETDGKGHFTIMPVFYVEVYESLLLDSIKCIKNIRSDQVNYLEIFI